MADMAVARKAMTIGEGGTALAFSCARSDFGLHRRECLHAGIRLSRVSLRRRECGGRLRHRRYYARPAELPPATINGKPDYNMGPVKFATVAAVIWGIASFTVGLWQRSTTSRPAGLSFLSQSFLDFYRAR